ncbi:MAG: DUF2461 domain-containing protein, partial [Bacteroidetes bacterium]|nr:DUF2461 domain-containing protein [Bacteroidota bacterium]
MPANLRKMISYCVYFARGGRKSRYAGYYIHIEPGRSFLGGGIYCPPSDVLREVRLAIVDHTGEFKKIIGSGSFLKLFGKIQGGK